MRLAPSAHRRNLVLPDALTFTYPEARKLLSATRIKSAKFHVRAQFCILN